MVKRSAFTMIELIFAIVIISISVFSLPMMNAVINKGIEGSLSQEAIFAASTELNQVVSLQWDATAMDTDTFLSRVVWTSASDCNTTTKLRPGHINQKKHRRCVNTDANRPSPIANGNSSYLNDVNTSSHSVYISASPNVTASASGYKNIYNSKLNVSYVNIDPNNYLTPNDKNMKKITVTISNADGNITQLTTFTSNIGEIDYHKRTY